MSEATRPTFFPSIPALDDTHELETSGDPTPEELALYSLSKGRGWRVFRGIAERALEDLRNINKLAIEQGLPLEEIGRNAVVASLAQGVIERLLHKVEDATDACTRTEGD